MAAATLRAAIEAQHGFLTPAQVADLARTNEDRLTPVLVRCGGFRFTAPAQDVAPIIDIITASGKDYVRDCSLPVGVALAEPEARAYAVDAPGVGACGDLFFCVATACLETAEQLCRPGEDPQPQTQADLDVNARNTDDAIYCQRCGAILAAPPVEAV